MADCTPITADLKDANGDIAPFPIPPPKLTPVAIDVASGFPATLVVAAAGVLTRVYRMLLAVDGDTTLTFMDGATTLAPAIAAKAGEQIVLDAGLFPFWQGAVNTDFKLNSSNAVQLTGAIWVSQNAS